VPHEIHAIGIYAVVAGDAALARAYIVGFNRPCPPCLLLALTRSAGELRNGPLVGVDRKWLTYF
jgi:hypothetical protein